MATFDYNAARLLVDKSHTCVNHVNTNQHVALNPNYIGHIGTGIRETLNRHLNLYSDELEGVPIAWGKVTCRQSSAFILDDQPFLHVDCSVESIVFQPKIGSKLVGIVNKKGNDYVGCLVHHVFNAAIYRLRDEKRVPGNATTWVGADLDIGQEVILEITKLHVYNGVVSMRGRLVEAMASSIPADEKMLSDQKISQQEIHKTDELDFGQPDTESSQSAKKRKKKRKNEKEAQLSSTTAHTSSEYTLTRDISISVTEKDNDKNSVRSFDSGLGNMTPPLEGGKQKKIKKEKKKKRESRNTDGASVNNEEENQQNVIGNSEKDDIINDNLHSVDNTLSNTLESDISTSKRKKKKRHKEKSDLGDNEASVEKTNETQISEILMSPIVIQPADPKPESASSSKKKKKKKDKKKKELENNEAHHVVLQSIESVSNSLQTDTLGSMEVSDFHIDIKTEPGEENYVESATSKGIKRKKKHKNVSVDLTTDQTSHTKNQSDSRHCGHEDPVTNEVGTFLLNTDCSAPNIGLDTHLSSKKKKKKRKREESLTAGTDLDVSGLSTGYKKKKYMELPNDVDL